MTHKDWSTKWLIRTGDNAFGLHTACEAFGSHTASSGLEYQMAHKD